MDQKAPDPAVRRVPRILVCGWSGAGNVGDELLASAVVGVLRSHGAIPIVVSRDPESTSALHKVEAVAWGPRGWRSTLVQGREGAKAAAAVDGVCVGPGGIIQDSSSVWSLPGHLLAPRRLRRMGKPVVGVGLGAEPLNRRSSRRLLSAVLKDAPVVARDAASAASLAAAGVEAAVGCDLVFGLGLEPLPRRAEIVVAVGPSVIPGRLRPASRRLSADDPSLVAAAIGAVAKRLGASVALTAFRGRRDLDYAQLLAARIRHDTEVLAPDTATQVERIRSARLLVSSRYHPVVVAARSGTPTVVCSTEPKIGSLVEQLSSPLVAKIDDWPALSHCEVAEPGSPVVPEGLGLHHEALRQLVSAASPAS
ncbi:MAG: polysaccharide pyruvyl transferase family protein [Acidimicrobiaceae bacterium]|nr:polysaccharide pyruvyl transferase family protein [Acidimicrobiaceae bacterium]